MKVSIVRTLSGWMPADDEAVRLSKKFAAGEVVVADIKRPRNLTQWRYYWQMCSLVSMNHDTLDSKDEVHEFLKLLVGHVKRITIDGKLHEIPLTTNFDSMDQDKANEYVSRCKEAVLTYLLPGVKDHTLEMEIARMASQ